MKSFFHRILSLVLAMAMVLGMVPMNAHATESVHTHEYDAVVTEPTCTEQGYTTYTCECGDSYVDDYVDAMGHSYAGGSCALCGEKAPDLAGKTLSILGASMSTYAGTSNGAAADTTNSTIRNNVKYYPNTTIPEVTLNDTWWMQAAKDLGLRLLVNNSWSGSSLLYERNGTVGAYVDRCVQLHDNTGDNAGEEPDIIAIQMGTNDFQYYKDTLGNADINYAALITDNGDGSYTYAEPVTSLEAAAIVLHKISVRYPNAEVYYLNISQRVDNTDELIRSFNADLKQVVEHFGAHIVDIYGSAITMDDFDTYIGDGKVHPNRLGMDAYTEAFKRSLIANTAYSVDTHIVSMELSGVSADYGDDKIVVNGDSFSVNLTSGDDLAVTVTMGGEDITDTTCADGTVTIEAVRDDVLISAQSIHLPKYYRWIFDGSDLVCVSGDNALTKNAGTTTDGVFSKTRYALETPVQLLHDLPWVVEWESEGTFKNSSGSSGARVFTSDDVNANYNARYIFKSANDWLIAMGEKTTTGSHNYGVALADYGIDGSESHSYRLENRIADDGSNMVWLYVDGKEIAPLNQYHIGTTDQNTTSDWLSGKDFVFPYMGTDTHGFTNAKIGYIQVWEGGHTHAYSTTVTAPTCTEQGYTTYTCECGDSYVDDYTDALGHRYENGICTGCGGANDYDGHLQELPESFCGGVNLWPLLHHDGDYFYAGTHWGSLDAVHSVTIPVNAGDRLAATSFNRGIRVTFFDKSGVLVSLTSDEVKDAYSGNGYLAVPEDAVAANIPMWDNSDANELYICNRSHSFTTDACDFCKYERLQVTAEDMNRTVGGVFAVDGTFTPSYTNNWFADIPIPRGAEQVRMLTFKTGVGCGSVFFGAGQYISGYSTTETGGQWVTLDIPAGADTFRYCYLYDRIAQDNGYPLFQYVEFYGRDLGPLEKPPFAYRPATGQHSFSVEVNIAPAMGMDGYVKGTDYGYIQLPTNYNPYGEPTRLIIVCHGAGASLSSYQSNEWKGTNYSFWTELGYAVMDMYACPPELTKNDDCLHFGNPVVLECYKKGYEYVLKHFNLKQDGIFLIGSSMGGLSSFQIAQSGQFPVIAQVGYCPAIDLFKQAYCNPWTTSSYQRSKIASYFGFTGAQPTFTNSKYPSAAEIDYYRQNFDKTIVYSPILCNVVNGGLTSIFDVVPSSATATDAEETAIYAQLTATHPNPLLIFHNTDDPTVSYRYSQYFVDMVNRSGQEAKLYTFTTGGHNAWANGESVTVSGINGQITIKESQYEAYLFFNQIEEHTDHYEWVDPAVAPTCTATGLTEGKHCARCGEVLEKQETVAKLDHAPAAVVKENEVKATCTKAGSYDAVIYCSVCNTEMNREPKTIDKLPHTQEIIPGKPATETETGLTEGMKCSVCGMILKEQEVIDKLPPSHVHDYQTFVTEATCTEPGYTTYTCTCGDSYIADEVAAKGHKEQTIPAVEATCVSTGLTEGTKCSVCDAILKAQEIAEKLPHAYKTAVTEATCTEPGYTTYTCTCGDSHIADEVPAKGHSYGEWTVIKEANCTEKGTEQHNCANCEAFETRAIEAVGHNYEELVTPPTCTQQGFTTHTCSCGDSFVDNEVEPLGHSFTEYVSDNNATCTEDGTKTAKCDRCDAEDTVAEVGSATGHKWNDGEVTKAPEAGLEGEMTYTCESCGDTRTEVIPALPEECKHTTTELVGQKDASCTETGYSGDKVCSTCGETIEIGTELPMEEHDAVIDEGVDATCTDPGLTEGKHCAVCGTVLVEQEVVDALGHDFGEWEIETEATCTDRGEELRFCAACDAFESRQTEATGHSFTDYISDDNANCTEDGTKTAICDNCDAEDTVADEGSAVGHDCDDGEITKEPAIGAEGIKTFTCRNCGETRTESIPALPDEPEDEPCTHSSVELVNQKDATCTETGYSGDRVCVTCGERIEQGSAVAKIAHTEVIDKAVAATCTKDGKTEGKHCSVCNTVLAKQETVPATGHSFGMWVETVPATSVSGGEEKRTCETCGIEEKRSTEKLTNPFVDVKAGAYYELPVLWAVKNGITNGMTPTTFQPDTECTRAQVVTFLWRASGEPEPVGKNNPFKDVLETDYFYKAVLWAVEEGITKGVSADQFAPGQSCTRAQVATFLWRAMGEPKAIEKKNPFEDIGSADYYYDAVLWAVENGVTNGMSETTFAPNSTCTRGQIVTFLYRALK